MHRTALVFGLLLAATAGAGAAPAPADGKWSIPVAVKRLDNGLIVVVSEDHSAPTFGICTAYRIGFRLEPRGRTGFAHLFEHMMFQGTPQAPKGTFMQVIEGGGGILNGSTRYDYTNYVASAPVSALDAILWLEADRMKTLDFSEKNLKNQQEVVKEEIRVSVKNRPYGLFFWTDVAAKAFDKWENSHDGYGSFADLDAARLSDVEQFFKSYYGPNNAVLAIAGDVKPEEVFAKVQKYFGGLPARPTPPPPDVGEPLNTAARSATETDALAKVPAVAVGWKMPARGSQDHVPAALLSDVLVGGEASRWYLALVKEQELVLNIDGGVNWPLGSPWDYNGPTLLTTFAIYKPTTTAGKVVAALNAEVQKIVKDGVPEAELQRVKTKMRSDLYSRWELPLSRATELCLAQVFTGRADTVNGLPDQIAAVTSADLQRVARAYLTTQNSTVIDRRPAPPAGAAPPKSKPAPGTPTMQQQQPATPGTPARQQTPPAPGTPARQQTPPPAPPQAPRMQGGVTP